MSPGAQPGRDRGSSFIQVNRPGSVHIFGPGPDHALPMGDAVSRVLTRAGVRFIFRESPIAVSAVDMADVLAPAVGDASG